MRFSLSHQIANPFKIKRGSLCVARRHVVNGCLQWCAFQIAPQANWKEWGGAFSLL
jgi:hypothetical protein